MNLNIITESFFSSKYDRIHNFIDQYAPILKAFKVSALKILIAKIIIFEPNAYLYPQQMIQGWDEDNIKHKTYFSPWNRMHILL